MTVINQAELDELSRLDQVLMWSIISINASNLDGRNNYISDNAVIRAESRDYIQWSVVQDEQGNGRFVFTALLPIVNPHPLKNKVSIIDRIMSYSPYDPDMLTESGITGYGETMPDLPPWIDTTEKLLAACALRATTVCKLAPLATGTQAFINSIRSQYWGSCQYQITDSAYGSKMMITGYLTLNWHTYLRGKSLIQCLDPIPAHASNINCNFPSIAELFNVPDINIGLPAPELIDLLPVGDYKLPPGGAFGGAISIDTEDTSAESLIDAYGQRFFIDDAVPDWYMQESNIETFVMGFTTITVTGDDAKAPQLIESLPTCKEQDPSIASYGKSPLISILTK